MKTFTLTFPDGSSLKSESAVSVLTILDRLGAPKNKILAVRINNDICSLSTEIDVNAELEPILVGSRKCSDIYRRSLCFVLAAAANSCFPETRLLVGHSLGYSYYYTLETGVPITKQDIDKLSSKMKELVEQDIVIQQDSLSYTDTLEMLKKAPQTGTVKQLKFTCPPKFKVNRLGDFCDLYFEPLVYSTGVLKQFDLMPYGKGFLLRFPSTAEPDKLSDFKDIPQLFSVYERYKNWGKQVGVTSAADLNELIHTRKTGEFIDIVETFQQKCIADIADMIHNRGNVKVVLIAGPSSSGKTTTSKKLSLQLRAIGYKPKVIELDTYYVERDKTPLDADGKYDYECLEALDIKQLNQDLTDLFNGKEIKLPTYDFTEGKRIYTGKTMNLEEKDILVLEGIHGLNDKLTPLVPAEYKFKIYLSALTQLNLDDLNRIPTSDNRLIRRIVRDSQFRGKSAADTISMWDSVQRGERLHIFPFQNNADVMLNTALDYELPVLKVYAEPLLRCVNPTQQEYAEASRLLRLLNHFSPIPANNVPGRSIIREFIGGSEFKY
ncbi:MAG: nucleoside kinase [Spirochaetaceae bacterium]|nr:nucleoside kinase [Spirochaetaceae bacterium]